LVQSFVRWFDLEVKDSVLRCVGIANCSCRAGRNALLFQIK
jgi:hypothetical protein